MLRGAALTLALILPLSAVGQAGAVPSVWTKIAGSDVCVLAFDVDSRTLAGKYFCAGSLDPDGRPLLDSFVRGELTPTRAAALELNLGYVARSKTEALDASGWVHGVPAKLRELIPDDLLWPTDSRKLLTISSSQFTRLPKREVFPAVRRHWDSRMSPLAPRATSLLKRFK
ncbi:MAG: hypothetical protein IT385_24600 [Deltaproteobacteria bacterium]|nr:hypothetical protein [Deltaproteobacteria bacterium]